MTRQKLTEHTLFKLAQYWWPKLALAGAILAAFWKISGAAHDFTDSVTAHLKHGSQIVEEQKITNEKLDVLIRLAAGRNRGARITGKN